MQLFAIVIIALATFWDPTITIHIDAQQRGAMVDVHATISTDLYVSGIMVYVSTSSGLRVAAVELSGGACTDTLCTHGEMQPNETLVLTATAEMLFAGEQIVGIAVSPADHPGWVESIVLQTAYHCYLPVLSS